MKTREDAIKEVQGIGTFDKTVHNENIEIELRTLTSEEIGRRKALIEYFDLENKDIETIMATMINCTSLLIVRNKEQVKEMKKQCETESKAFKKKYDC